MVGEGLWWRVGEGLWWRMRRGEVQAEQATRDMSWLIPPDRSGTRKTEADAECLLPVCRRGATEATLSALPLQSGGNIRHCFNKPCSGAQVEFTKPSRCAEHQK